MARRGERVELMGRQKWAAALMGLLRERVRVRPCRWRGEGG